MQLATARAPPAAGLLIGIIAFFPWWDVLIRFGGACLGLPSAALASWDELLLLLCLLAAWAEWRAFGSQRDGPFVPRGILIGMLVLALSNGFAILVNRVPFGIAVDALRTTYQPMLFTLALMVLLRSGALADRLVDLSIACATSIAVFALAQYAFAIESPRWFDGRQPARAVSIFANPNALAGYLNLAIALAFARALYGPDFQRALPYWTALTLLVAALVVTFSRAAWIACALMCLYLASTTARRIRWGLVALGAMAAATAPLGVADRLGELLDPGYYQESAAYGRLSFWADAWASMLEHPWFGVGPGMHGGSVAIRHGVPNATWVDNHYLKLGAEIGVIGLAAFLWVLLAACRHARFVYDHATSGRGRMVSLAASGMIIATVVQNATASTWEALYVGTSFYALVGLIFAQPKPADRYDGSADHPKPWRARAAHGSAKRGATRP